MESWATVQTVETSQIDLRLQPIRQRDATAERWLLESILAEGIKQPLLVVMPKPSQSVLLDGFKRYRCARRLDIGVVPVRCVEGDERGGLLTLLRESQGKGLSELEYGTIVDRLHSCHGMSVRQIAQQLGCSIGWVGMRLGMVEQMSAVVRHKVLSGQFPPRAYLYSVRPFTRVNGVDAAMIERFVTAVSGRGLSTRDAFLLTHAYFEGSRNIKNLIEQGNCEQVLEALKSRPVVGVHNIALSEILDDIRSITGCMDRLIQVLPSTVLEGEIAGLRAHLAAAGIVRRMSRFTMAMRNFYDRTTETLGGNGVVPTGDQQAAHSADAGAGPEDGQLGHCHQWGATTASQQDSTAAVA